MACRDLKKAKSAAEQIIKCTKNESVFVEELDLADFDSIRRFAQRFKAKYNRLDYLINNAGELFSFFILIEA